MHIGPWVDQGEVNMAKPMRTLHGQSLEPKLKKAFQYKGDDQAQDYKLEVQGNACMGTRVVLWEFCGKMNRGWGYLNNLSATTAAITNDGWFKMGNIPVCNADGFFMIYKVHPWKHSEYVLAIDIHSPPINKGSKVGTIPFSSTLLIFPTVPPVELKSLLIQHPDVADAAVIGVPSKEATKLPRAFVVPVQTIEKEEMAMFALGIPEWVA
ncbi:hypothetical protein EDD16DRAFT_1791918 [Pisolithus croceorrhizus]|nr:hypothetical protein EDD16DRAFT_1791918 [Pisolithus croceorrhizus]